jgi:hypothetical protein
VADFLLLTSTSCTQLYHLAAVRSVIDASRTDQALSLAKRRPRLTAAAKIKSLAFR